MNKSINSGITYMIGAQAMLAIMATCVRALKTLPLMEIVFLRSVGGIIMVASYMIVFNISFQGKQRFDLIMRGSIGFIALACYYYAITNLALSTATLLANTSPVLVVILAGIFFHEPIGLKLIALISLSLIGIVLLLEPEFNNNIMGYTVGLVAAFFIALAFLYLRKLKSENSFLVVFYFVTISGLGSAPFALTQWVAPTLEQWGLVLVIAISTFFGQIWLTLSFQKCYASIVSAAAYLGPVFCWILGLLIFNETMKPSATLGATIILVSGIALTFLGNSSMKKESKN